MYFWKKQQNINVIIEMLVFENGDVSSLLWGHYSTFLYILSFRDRADLI